MSHITAAQLDHLAKLCRIQLTSEDKTVLLPQLEQIISFVSQLDEVEIEKHEVSGDIKDVVTTALREGVVDAGLTEKLLANVQHPIEDNSIEITGTLSEE